MCPCRRDTHNCACWVEVMNFSNNVMKRYVYTSRWALVNAPLFLLISRPSYMSSNAMCNRIKLKKGTNRWFRRYGAMLLLSPPFCCIRGSLGRGRLGRCGGTGRLGWWGGTGWLGRCGGRSELGRRRSWYCRHQQFDVIRFSRYAIAPTSTTSALLPLPFVCCVADNERLRLSGLSGLSGFSVTTLRFSRFLSLWYWIQ